MGERRVQGLWRARGGYAHPANALPRRSPLLEHELRRACLDDRLARLNQLAMLAEAPASINRSLISSALLSCAAILSETHAIFVAVLFNA